jgi:high-affinity Fe2+/Pb2+ permease
MSVVPQPRPGVVFMVCGALFLGLSVARLAINWAPGPGWPWFELGNGVVAAALLLWGWSRLRRAKAARPDLSWWQFLHGDLIGLGLAVVLLSIVAALSPEQRNSLMNSLLEIVNLISMAKGQL